MSFPRVSLAVRNITCVRGGRTVFSDLSLRLEPGEALHVTGPNGSGKSTLLCVLAGLLAPRTGLMEWTGGGDGATFHYIGHRNGVPPALTVMETTLFWTRFLGAGDPRAAACAALEHAGLAPLADLPCARLSQGQRRRLALARLHAAPRPVWLLDEPAAGLDDSACARLAAQMRTHQASGGMIISTGHGPGLLRRAAVLDLGVRPGGVRSGGVRPARLAP